MKLAPKFATCSQSTLKPVFKQGVPNLFSFRQKWGQILVRKGVKSKIQIFLCLWMSSHTVAQGCCYTRTLSFRKLQFKPPVPTVNNIMTRNIWRLFSVFTCLRSNFFWKCKQYFNEKSHQFWGQLPHKKSYKTVECVTASCTISLWMLSKL